MALYSAERFPSNSSSKNFRRIEVSSTSRGREQVSSRSPQLELKSPPANNSHVEADEGYHQSPPTVNYGHDHAALESTCEFCNFRGTAEELLTHRRECKNAVECPNGCKDFIMRSLLDVHKSTCVHRLVCCKHPGCTEEFMKKDEQKHYNNNTALHVDQLLSLTDSRFSKLKKELQNQEEKYTRELESLREELRQEKEKSEIQQQKIEELTDRIMNLEIKLSNFERKHNSQQAGSHVSFCMENFSLEKTKLEPWRSPQMSTKEGYQFLIEVYDMDRIAFKVTLYAVKSMRDEQLKWPAKVCFTLTLVNFKGGEDKKVFDCFSWERPTEMCQFVSNIPVDSSSPFVEHSKLPFYLNGDQLHFDLFVITED